MREVDISILHAVFRKHNKLTARYAWEPKEIAEWETLMMELKHIQSVFIQDPSSSLRVMASDSHHVYSFENQTPVDVPEILT